ncbi:MAG: shikimate kinase [Spirochaetaceae bacterium]|jgi:shikimate kinase|nr:shikimate kinase [Spirochaetaceae bacterium]
MSPVPLLVLTGPKHSGKTSAGYALREVLGWDFADLDAVIEKREGVTARTLYRRGRDVFQKAETEAVISLQTDFTTGKPMIVAGGGGLIDNDEAVTAFAKNPGAIIVYLEVSAATAWSRIEGSGNGLPPFLNVENPKLAHAALHERRAAAYRKLARIIINAEKKTPGQIALEIVKHINGKYPPPPLFK